MPDTTDKEELLAGLVEEYLEARRMGEAPTLSAFAGAHPECREELLDLLKGLEEMENLYITFENLTDTQVDVNFKYTFTYYARNPDTGYYEPVIDTESFLNATARRENNTLIFEGNGIKGKIELNTNYAWLFIEESTDERFKLGWFCSDQLIGDTIE